MTDETKKLFDAPWEVCLEKRGSFYRPCVCSSDTKIASVCTKENANRIEHLPELYDALLDEIRAKCNTCIHDNIQLWRVPFINHFNTIQSGCPFKDSQCHTVKHIEIIQKVRDGE